MRVSAAERYERLLRLARSIERTDVREIVLDLLKEPKITFADVTPKISFLESPAAPKAHHSYPGGLVDHTLGVVRIADALAEYAERTYGVEVDRDVVLGSALIHDVFKYYQYERDPVTGGFRPREDWYLAHDFALVAELSKRGAPDDLVRACAEVHGVYGRSLEGKLVHMADTVDTKFARELQDLVYSVLVDLERETNGKVLAIKAYYQLVERLSLFELAKIAMREGRDALREKVKEVLGV